jgi:lysylphosphatidylglycerol synthetase-like protein (DUF2156 family)
MLTRRLAAEIQSLWNVVRSIVQHRISKLYLTWFSALLIIVLSCAVHIRTLHHTVIRLAGTVQAGSLNEVLLRTPLSTFFPDEHLLAVGAVLQVVIVLAIAESVLGWRRTFVIGFSTQFAINILVHTSLHGHIARMFRVATHDFSAIDSGPSAVVIALALATAIEMRYRVLASIASTSLLVSLVVSPHLDGVEHAIAIALGAALWWMTHDLYARSQVLHTPPHRSMSRVLVRRRAIRRLIAGIVFSVGLAALIATIVFPHSHKVERYVGWSLGWRHAAVGVAAASGVGLIVVAAGLARGLHRAWAITAIMLGAIGLTHTTHSTSPEITAYALLALVFVLATGGSFAARSITLPLRVALNRLLLSLGALFVAAFISAEAVFHLTHQQGSTAGITDYVFDALFGWPNTGSHVRTNGFFHAALFGSAAMLALVAFGSILRPAIGGAVSSRQRKLDEVRARTTVQKYGAGTLDYFSLRDDKLWFFWNETLIAYTVRFGVCVVSPDPIGPQYQTHEAWEQFRRFVDRQGWFVCILGANEPWKTFYESMGMSSIYAGDEGIVETKDFTVRGRANKGVRQAATRVERYGYRVEFFDPLSISPQVKSGVLELLEKSRRGGVERGFSMTLGRIFDHRDEGMLMAVCFDKDNVPVAFCQYTPCREINGWSLDLMRRDMGNHPNGLLDFVIVETINHVRETSGGGLGLNFATMRGVLAAERGTGPLRRAQSLVLKKLSDDMQIESLWKFNDKFNPRWLERYVVIDGWENLIHVGLAIASAESLWELPVIGRWLVPKSSRVTAG